MNKIKSFKEFINESLFGNMTDKGRGETVKKEDEIVSNIKELKPIDMGGSILWADKDLESNDDVYFSFPDANNIIKNSGWRLPTWWEILELTKVSAIYKNTFEECKLHANANDLIFEKCGYQYADEDRVLNPDSYYAWTSDTAKSGSGAYLTIFIRKHIAAVPLHYLNKCCVRLVKDK